MLTEVFVRFLMRIKESEIDSKIYCIQGGCCARIFRQVLNQNPLSAAAGSSKDNMLILSSNRLHIGI